MYDVLYLTDARQPKVLAKDLRTEAAASVARREAQRLRVGRMFGAGSETASLKELVLIVESEAPPA